MSVYNYCADCGAHVKSGWTHTCRHKLAPFEREPPHCPTCDCGMQSPGANVADPVPGLTGPSNEVIDKLEELIALTGPHSNGDTALYWHLVATLNAHRKK